MFFKNDFTACLWGFSVLPSGPMIFMVWMVGMLFRSAVYFSDQSLMVWHTCWSLMGSGRCYTQISYSDSHTAYGWYSAVKKGPASMDYSVGS